MHFPWNSITFIIHCICSVNFYVIINGLPILNFPLLVESVKVTLFSRSFSFFVPRPFFHVCYRRGTACSLVYISALLVFLSLISSLKMIASFLVRLQDYALISGDQEVNFQKFALFF